MPSIAIDYDKCARDRLCIEACPYTLFEEGEKGRPLLVKGAEQLCIDCGHCMAICPFGAISVGGVDPETLPTRDVALAIAPEQLEQFVRHRRSVRCFKPARVDRELLDRLVDVVRWAPTARNRQPVRWLLCDDAATIRTLGGHVADWFRAIDRFTQIADAFEAGRDGIMRDAPALAVAYAADDALRPAVDCAIAATTMELLATAHGLGVCWAGYFMAAAQNHAPLAARLAMPERHTVHAALLLGHPKHHYAKLPPRNAAQRRWLE